MTSPQTWREFLEPYRQGGTALFGEAFLGRWGAETWAPTGDDRKAAGRLHTQIASRITTQRLGYLDGVEKTALTSVYSLFQKTRDIADALPDCRHFDALAWEVLNRHVRPFTAKWHRESERGALEALDATDEFRGQLAALQPILQRFDELLVHLRDDQRPPAPGPAAAPTGEVAKEMDRAMRWGISRDFGGIEPASAQAIHDAERTAIRERRTHYGLDPDKPNAAGLALSGGGIRSATFSLGVLVALARRNVLPHFDYLSTVSGGGYLGSFLSAFLQSPGTDVGLRADELPFRREEGEAAALKHIRHHSKYLATRSLWRRLTRTSAQLYGMLLNTLAFVWLVALAVAVERGLRALPRVEQAVSWLTRGVAIALPIGAVVALLALRHRGRLHRFADAFVAIPAVALLVLLGWHGLAMAQAWFGTVSLAGLSWSTGDKQTWVAVAGAVPAVVSALMAGFGRLTRVLGLALVALSAVAVPLFAFGVYLVLHGWGAERHAVHLGPLSLPVPWIVVAAGLPYLLLLDVNTTSPHRHYRQSLAEAYLIQRLQPNAAEHAKGVSLRLSALSAACAPYPLFNCALNVPASKDTAMQGRLTDFFLFSPRYSGSPLTGYWKTEDWEGADPHLDLGTAMAVSGAAAAPQMGLGTLTRLRFWLALLNVRLGYWARQPEGDGSTPRARPGIRYLVKEMLGTMDEQLPFVHLSDGGHIENLGVYELLRRRCQYIVAVDGEEDAQMTFHALTNLQRMAAIDLGVHIDIDLDDLRLNTRGLSRSHFRFCRIRYPKEGDRSRFEYGYLLYLKLSLTGNEGEFLRRYRLDEPVFPHHSTADQFFSETQFEAYRTLGEHVGDKLFLSALVGPALANAPEIEVEEWFRELGQSLLEPLPS